MIASARRAAPLLGLLLFGCAEREPTPAPTPTAVAPRAPVPALEVDSEPIWIVEAGAASAWSGEPTPRQADWPCASETHYADRDEALRSSATFTYGGPAECRLPRSERQAAGCPTLVHVELPNLGAVERRFFYYPDGRLARIEEPSRDGASIARTLLVEWDRAGVVGVRDRGRSRTTRLRFTREDGEERVERIDRGSNERLEWWTHELDERGRTVRHREDNPAVSALVSTEWDWEGERLIALRHHYRSGREATLRFDYACEPSEEDEDDQGASSAPTSGEPSPDSPP